MIKNQLISVVKILNFWRKLIEIMPHSLWLNILISQSWIKPYFSNFQAKKCLLNSFVFVPEMHLNSQIFPRSIPPYPPSVLPRFAHSIPSFAHSITRFDRSLWASKYDFWPLKNFFVAQVKFLGHWPKTLNVEHLSCTVTVIKFCIGLGKSPVEMMKLIGNSETMNPCSLSVMYKRNGRKSTENDSRDGRPYVVKMTTKDIPFSHN